MNHLLFIMKDKQFCGQKISTYDLLKASFILFFMKMVKMNQILKIILVFPRYLLLGQVNILD